MILYDQAKGLNNYRTQHIRDRLVGSIEARTMIVPISVLNRYALTLSPNDCKGVGYIALKIIDIRK